MQCEGKDFMFPMQVDVFYPIVEQGTYGNVKKQWILNKIVACHFTTAGLKAKEEITPNVNITQDTLLIGRVKSDIRISNLDAGTSLTNILLTNIQDRNCNNIYTETTGPRAGKSTLFEVASQEPFVGPFGRVEYYKLVLRRSENQAVDI
jgi:hypothetical protein